MAKIAEQKVIGLLIAGGLCAVAAIFWVIDPHKDKSEQPQSETVAVTPAAPKDTTTGTVAKSADEHLSKTPWSGKILVSKRPVQVLAAPSSSASAMYGFPAGRPFRALGSEGGYVRIQDVKSGASGWIEEAALEPAEPPKPTAAQTGSSAGGSATSSRSSGSRSAQTVAPSDNEPVPAAPPKRRGLFGGGGIFGGLFGN